MKKSESHENIELLKESFTIGVILSIVFFLILLGSTQFLIHVLTAQTRAAHVHPREYLVTQLGLSCGIALDKQYVIIGETHFSKHKINELQHWVDHLQFDLDY